MDIEADLIDHSGFQERFGQIATAHDTDLFAVLLLKAADKFSRIIVQDGYTIALARLKLTRKDVSRDPLVRIFDLFLR